MCGIFGFTGSPDSRTLSAMGQALVHRGPDDGGSWESAEASLGMRRLSIVDLSTGNQPVHNEDGSVTVVFNGEIYNHRELRRRLESEGHVFRSSHSDTEVIPHLYEAHGTDLFSHLTGMFAIALWDERRKLLLLGRDHCGIKPLYYRVSQGKLLFASELKSLFEHPDVTRRPNFRALHHYFSFKNIPAPLTAYEGIEQLRAGELVTFQGGKSEKRRWWRIRFAEEPGISEGEAAREILGLLDRSVSMQLEADVPVGAYLSGGLDSSSVVALMSRRAKGRIKTFTLAYADKELNAKAADVSSARRVAELFQTDHHEYLMSKEDLLRSVHAIVEAFDEPFSGTISTYFLTRLVARHVKVAFSGDGADELFGSYLPHRLAFPLHRLREIEQRRAQGGDWRPLAEPFADRLEYLHAVHDRGDEAARRMGQYVFDEQAKRSLYSQKMLREANGESSEALLRALYDQAGTTDPLNRALFLDFETLLPDQVLTFSDRLSMAHSVELRPPFLDPRLVEYVARLPGQMKIRHGRVKHILKEAVAPLLPQELIDRPKEGFVLPLNDWLLSGFRSFVTDALSPERLSRHGLLKPEGVADVLAAHYSGTVNHGVKIWNLLMFQLWWEKYFT